VSNLAPIGVATETTFNMTASYGDDGSNAPKHFDAKCGDRAAYG
jgi:hypothetical protein